MCVQSNKVDNEKLVEGLRLSKGIQDSWQYEGNME